jgi:hypothetical protein
MVTDFVVELRELSADNFDLLSMIPKVETD